MRLAQFIFDFGFEPVQRVILLKSVKCWISPHVPDFALASVHFFFVADCGQVSAGNIYICSTSISLTLMRTLTTPISSGSLQVASIPRCVCLSSDARDAPAGTLRAWAHALMASIPSPATCAAEEAGAFDTDVAAVTLQVFLEHIAGARSALAPWMAVLNGKGDLNLPALWPARDLEALRGTLVLQEVEGCLARAEMERNVVAAAIASALGEQNDQGREEVGETNKLLASRWLDFGEMEARPTHRDWLHARCAVQSRAYRVGQR